jgi:hypothetical protein
MAWPADASQVAPFSPQWIIDSIKRDDMVNIIGW